MHNGMSVTAEVVLRAVNACQGAVLSVASDLGKLPPYETLARAFPPTRITLSRGTWWNLLYFVVTFPFNLLVLMPVRVVIGFSCLPFHMAGLVDVARMMCFFCRWSYKVRGPPGATLSERVTRPWTNEQQAGAAHKNLAIVLIASGGGT